MSAALVTLALVGAILGTRGAHGVVGSPAGCSGLALVDASAAAGIDVLHQRGNTGRFHLPETIGAGVAWIDYDGDGLLDLYVVQSGPFPPDGSTAAANRLYRNRGDGTFREVEGAAGAADRGYGQGAVAADVNGDGRTDLYVTNFGGDVLYLNLENGFERRGAEHDLGDPGWGTSAAFGDADGDGDLDLYVAHYVAYDIDAAPFCRTPDGELDYCDPHLFRGEQDRFYRNDGDGRFREATAAAGLIADNGKGLGVVFTDLDGDGRPDLYVANDATPNFLFANRGDGTFEDVSLLSGAALSPAGQAQAGMGIGVGDLDDDGMPEIAVTNFDAELNALYRNLGAFAFADGAAPSGFGVPSFNLLGFGIAIADLDADGDLDAFIGNGHVLERPPREGVGYAQPDLLLLADGSGAFAAATCGLEALEPRVTRAVAVADYDDDGDLDLALSASGGRLRLLRNDADPADWLGLTLRGAGSNSGAIGARVRIVHADRAVTRWLLAGDSYLSSGDPRILYAWPQGSSAPEAIAIDWPSGAATRHPYDDAMRGRYSVIEEPEDSRP